MVEARGWFISFIVQSGDPEKAVARADQRGMTALACSNHESETLESSKGLDRRSLFTDK
jgi:hypothetical protein